MTLLEPLGTVMLDQGASGEAFVRVHWTDGGGSGSALLLRFTDPGEARKRWKYAIQPIQCSEQAQVRRLKDAYVEHKEFLDRILKATGARTWDDAVKRVEDLSRVARSFKHALEVEAAGRR